MVEHGDEDYGVGVWGGDVGWGFRGWWLDVMGGMGVWEV